jgi:hypothetical protein
MNGVCAGRRVWQSVALVAAGACFRPLALAQEATVPADSAEALVARCEAYFRGLPPMKLVLDSKNYFSSDTEPERCYKDTRFELVIDHNSHRMRLVSHPRPVPSGPPKERLSIFERVYTPDAYFVLFSPLVDRSKVYVESRTKPYTRSEWRSNLADFPFLACWGILPWESADDLPARMRKLPMQLTATEGQADGLIRLAGADADLSLEVWLDASLRGCPKKVVFQRNVDDPMAIVQYEYEVQRVQFVDGYPFPAAFSVRCVNPEGNMGQSAIAKKYAESAGIKMVDRMEPRRTHRDESQVAQAVAVPSLSPADFAPTMQIAEGTRVRMRDAPQLRYVWLKGQVVPETDPRALAAVRQASYSPAASHSGRLWLSVASVGILVAVAVILLWRRRQ